MTPRTTRSGTVLGKRAHQAVPDSSSSPESARTDNLVEFARPLTPDPTPKSKRARTITLEEGDGNKENIPPLRSVSSIESLHSGRVTRSLRRTSTPAASSRESNTHQPLSCLLPPLRPSPVSTSPPLPRHLPSDLPLYARARALLRATCNSTALISGRNQERDLITAFFTAFLTSEVGGDACPTLYISGLPGTGKTALVNSIVRDLEVGDARIIVINCMALNNVDSLWDRLSEELTESSKPKGRGRFKKLKGKEAVNKLLAESTIKCVVILDELDHIAQSELSLVPLFAIANSHIKSMRIVGIANTHTLTSSKSSCRGVEGVTTLHFAPYSGEQLLSIVQLRFSSLSENADDADAMKKFLPVPTLSLLSKKVAAQTGDVRAVFEVLRGAIDLAGVPTQVSAEASSAAPVVTPSHVLAALKAYTPSSSAPSRPAHAASAAASGSSRPLGSGSELATKVRQLGFQARLVLLAILLASKRLESGLSLGSSSPSSPAPSPSKSPMKRTQSAGMQPPALSGLSSMSMAIDGAKLHGYYTTLLTRDDADTFSPVSRSEFADLLGMLETVGLVALFSSAPSTPTKGGRRPIARTGSFGGGLAKGAAAKGAHGQEVRLADGARVDELLRGLGVQASTGMEDTADVDVREEEVRALWARENSRITKEAKSRASARAGDVFADATED